MSGNIDIDESAHLNRDGYFTTVEKKIQNGEDFFAIRDLNPDNFYYIIDYYIAGSLVSTIEFDGSGYEEDTCAVYVESQNGRIRYIEAGKKHFAFTEAQIIVEKMFNKR